MKKIIAIVMALVMMMAVTIPAFAEDTTQYIEQDTPVSSETGAQESSVDVLTTFDDDDWSYKVTIPAGVTVPWNDTNPQAMTYYVESQLLIGARLKVSATANDNGVMKSSGTTETLTFTVAGGDEVEFKPVNPANTTAPGVVSGENVSVKIDDFAGKPVGNYTGTLTYTVTYVAPTV